MTLLAIVALRTLAPAPLADLPFERVGNRIYLKGTLNGRAANTVVDSGAGATVADLGLAFAVGAKRVQKVQAGGAGAQKIAAWVVSDLSLQLVGTPVRQGVSVALPLEPLTKLEGRPLETILGSDFLNRYRVEVDYAASRVRLFDPKDDSVPTGATVLPLTFAGNLPHTQGQVEIPGLGTQEVTMMLDTGATSGFNFSNRAVRRLKLDERFAKLPELTTAGGLGGETKGRRIRVPWAEIGGARLERPVALLDSTSGGATGSGATFDVLVGGEALRRYTVTFDYAHRRAFLVPNAARAEPFVGDLTGLSFVQDEGGYRVREVVPDSPAKAAGLLKGDLAVSFDEAKPPTLEAVRQLLRKAQGDLRVKYRRGRETRTAVLKTRELIP